MLTIPRSPEPRVSVIIPCVDGNRFLQACLRSLAANAPRDLPFETIVVVNDAPASDVTGELAGATFLASRANLGLAGAGNRGRRVARGEFLLLLHDDAEVEPGWMEALVAAADADPQAGAIGGKVLDPDGTLQNAGMVLHPDGTTGPPWSGAPPDPSAFDERRKVDYCGTSSLLVRAATWDAIGGLDEQFFPAYYVDVDLAAGIRALGQHVLYEPRSVIRHHRGSSTSRRFALYVTARNRERFLMKWGGGAETQRAPHDESLEAQELRHLLAERDLLRDYARDLAATIDARERTLLARIRRKLTTLLRMRR